MAESYRGLTIKIGGDTTKLNKALHTTNQAISGTQSSMKKLSDALKLDPTSFKAAQLQVGAVAEQASNAAARVSTLNEAIKQVGSKIPSNSTKSIEELAGSLDNIQMSAARARDYYSGLTKTIATSYTELSRLHSEAAKVAGVKLSENLKESVASFDFGKIREGLTELKTAFGTNKGQTTSLLRELGSLEKQYNKLAEEAQKYKDILSQEGSPELIDTTINFADGVLPKMREGVVEAAMALQETSKQMDVIKGKVSDLVEEIAKYKGVGTEFKFDNENVDLDSLTRALEQIAKTGNLPVEKVDELRAKFAALKSTFKSASEELKLANTLAEFEDLQAEAAKAEAKVANLVNEMVALSDTSRVATALASINEQLQDLSARGAGAKDTLAAMQKILKEDSGNEEAKAIAMQAYADEVEYTRMMIENLQNQIAEYERDDEIAQMAASTQSFARETERARDVYKAAATELETYDGILQQYKNDLASIEAAHAEDSSYDFGDDSEYQKLKNKIAELEPTVDSLRASFNRAAAEKEKFVQVGELRDAQAQLVTYKDTLRDLTEIKIKPEVDVSFADGLDKALKALSNGAFDIPGVTEFAKQTKNAATALDEAKSHYQALAEASKADPMNTELLHQRSEALDKVVEKTVAHIEALRQEIEKVPEKAIDQDALDAGTVTEKLDAAREKVNEYKLAIVDLNNRIKELTSDKDKLVPLANVNEEAAGKVSELTERIKELKDTRDKMADEGDKAFETLVVEENTKRIEENREALTRETTSLHNLAEESRKIHEIDATPRFDVSATEQFESALKDMSSMSLESLGFKELGDRIDVVRTSLAEATTRTKKLDEALKVNPNNVELLQERARAASTQIALSAEEQRLLNQVIKQLDSTKLNTAAKDSGTLAGELAASKKAAEEAIASMKGYDEVIAKVNKEISKIEDIDEKLRTESQKKQLETLRSQLSLLTASYKIAEEAANDAMEAFGMNIRTKVIEDAIGRVTELDTATGKLAESAKKAGNQNATPKVDEAAFMQVVERISQAVRQMGQEIVQSSNEIDTAYRDMRKTVQGTEEDFARLREQAVSYSQNSITSADQMLEMQALGGQLGVAVENLEQFGKIASTLDIATDIDAENVALKLGQISNVLGLDIDGMQGFADALVRLGNNMPAQESSIMAVAQRFAAVATTANFSGDEVLAWSAAIAATGQRSEAAATAISNTVSGIEQAVANGGSELKQFAAIAGMSSDEFVDSWKQGPTEVLRAFITGLETLKDSDKSAVAALENMGITGVRQQQTLLALTQTIDSLDKALAMSGDAWNQVSDQWGTAGDAAIEAQKKSAGFSGALAIMQNNAQNLAASMGDGLIPFMKAASSVMEFLTDTLSNLPPFAKSALIFLGGTTAALGVLNPMIEVFSKGIAGTIAAMSKSSSMLDLIARLTGLSGAFEGAAAQGVNLTAALGGMAPAILGVSAAAVAIGVAINAINEYNESQETFRRATDGMTEAAKNARAAYEEYTESMKPAITTVRELKAETDEVIESQAALVNSMEAKWEDVGTNAASVDYFAQKIVELSEQESLTASEQSELNTAVEAFNDITGSTIEILDAKTGKLSETKDAIYKTADAWKQLAVSEAAYEMYRDVIKQRIEDEMALEKVTDSMKETQKDWAEWEGKTVDEVDLLSHATMEQRKEYERLTEAISSADATAEQYLSYMTTTDRVVSEMRQALSDAGKSVEFFDDLNKEELAQLVAVWDGSIESIVSVMDEIAKRRGEVANSIANELDETSKAAYAALADAYKVQAKADYDATKAELDAIYKAKQREYNADYKALQKSLDAAYKAQQKAYDNEYKALQKQLDKQYKAVQKQLDAEYDARKKSYDDQLKALKKSQEAEIKAFNDATDAKLKAMEKEYNQRVKLLELDYGGKTDKLDEQIDALNAETEAEKAAIEEREEQEKIAELQKAVDQAKSRRKRADAEKALNDYLEEIQQKHNETERNAQIEALKQQQQDLKDELAERKETLKEQYDAEVAAYKDNRAAQLEAIKEANTAEYDAEKERLDGLLEQLKESHTQRLESLKESQSAQLEALKESQQSQLEAMKDAQQDQLESLKESQQAELENLKASQTKQLQDLKAFQDAKYNAIKNGEDEEAKQQVEANTKKEQNQKKSNASMISEQERHMEKMNEHMNRKLTEMDKAYGSYGEKAPLTFASALEAGAGAVARAADSVASEVKAPFEGLNNDSPLWGQHMLANLNNGIVDEWNRGTILNNVRNIAQNIRNILGFSVPKEGPMSDADKWGPDMVQLIADGIRDEQNTLVRRVEKMSRAVEDAFDPTLTVDAAYEALDTIGKNRSRVMGSIIENHSAPNISLTLNMDLSNVSFRSDDDIDKLAEAVSQKMAAQAARQLAGRLGR